MMNSDGSDQVQVTDNTEGNVNYFDWSPSSNSPPSSEVPEFPTLALPILSVIGLMVVLRRRK